MAKRSPPPIKQADEAAIRRAAGILGESSAAARAIGDLDARRAAGEDASIYQQGAVLLVGPRIDSEAD